MDLIRKSGKHALSLTFDEDSAKIIEVTVYKNYGDREKYRDTIYEIVGIKVKYDKSITTEKILSLLNNGRTGWNSPSYDKYNSIRKEKDVFLEKPEEIEEGVFTCKCGSKQTYNYTKQVRSADEGMSVFVICCKCGNKWRES